MTDTEKTPQCRAQMTMPPGGPWRCILTENHAGPHKDEDNDTWDITYVDEPGVSPQAIPVDIRVRPVQDQLTALTARVGLLEADRACAPVYLAEQGKEQGDYLHDRTHGDLIKELYQRLSDVEAARDRQRRGIADTANRVDKLERLAVALREDNSRLHTRLNEAQQERDAVRNWAQALPGTDLLGLLRDRAQGERCTWVSPTARRCVLLTGHGTNHLTPVTGAEPGEVTVLVEDHPCGPFCKTCV